MDRPTEFTGIDSAHRLERLQQLVKDSTISTKSVDGVLIVGGIDSHHAETCQAVLKYLFVGSSGQELVGNQVFPSSFEFLEDVMLLISRHGIEIFYSVADASSSKILPIISQWTNVTEYVVHDKMTIDVQEELKVRAFREMMDRVKCVGIPYGLGLSSGQNLEDDMIPEKWPIIQSYGLETGEKESGFLSMNRQITNVSSQIIDVLSEVDTFTSKRLCEELPPIINHHFDQFLHKVDLLDAEARQKTPELALAEDLVSFYEFGSLQSQQRGIEENDPLRGSRLLFGTRTNSPTQNSSSSITLQEAGLSDEVPATHMLVHVEDPFTGVRLTRTYFTSVGVSTTSLDQPEIRENDIADEDIDERQQVKVREDTQLLMAIYRTILHGLRAGFKCMTTKGVHTEKASISDIQTDFSLVASSAMSSFVLKYGECNYYGSLCHAIEHRLSVTFDIMDSCGRSSRELDRNWVVAYVLMQVEDVRAVSMPSHTLGSVCVGDTLLLRSSYDSVRASASNRAVNLTEHIKYVCCWRQSGQEEKTASAMKNLLYNPFQLESKSIQLGYPIVVDDEGEIKTNSSSDTSTHLQFMQVHLLLDDEDISTLEGILHLFQRGFIFETPQMTPMLISFERHVDNVCVIKTSYENMSLMKITFHDEQSARNPLQESLPFGITGREVYMPLVTGTRMQREMIQVLEIWKSFASRDDLFIYKDSNNSYTTEIPIPTKRACDDLMRRDSINPNIAPSEWFSTWKLPMPSVQKDSPTDFTNSATMTPITVFLGIPGSEVHVLSRSIKELSSNENNWLSLEIDMRECQKGENIYQYMQKQVEAIVAKVHEDSQTTSHRRLLVSICGYVDVRSVTGVIDGINYSYISAVIACINATCVYKPQEFGSLSPYPTLFDQTLAGFTTHILLTNTSHVKETCMKGIRLRLSKMNPYADVYLMPHRTFERSLASLLGHSYFSSKEYTEYRKARFGQWKHQVINDEKSTTNLVMYKLASGMNQACFIELVAKTLSPYAILDKSMKVETHPSLLNPLRLAQSAAALKVYKDHRSDASGNGSFEDNSEAGRQECWVIEGLLNFQELPDQTYEHLSTGLYAYLRPAQTQLKTPDFYLTITGKNLDEEKLRDALLNCYRCGEEKVLPLRTKNGVSAVEKQEIQKQHSMDPLPEGYMFDGVHYYDFTGAKFDFHPEIDKFIDDHLLAINKHATTANNKLEEHCRNRSEYVTKI